MKNFTKYLLIIFIFTGCYQYSEHTYPTLDGTYTLNSIVLQKQNGEVFEYDDPLSFVYPNAIGPLDSLKVNKTRIHISGTELEIGHQYINYQIEYKYKYFFDINRDPLTGEWCYLNIDYMVNGVIYPRNFIIIRDGAEILELRGPTREVDGEKYHYTLTFDRIDS
jgi:hypothetical protein